MSLRDYDNQPTDLFPKYIEHRSEGKRTIFILSDNPPVRLIGAFLRNITPFNLNSPIEYNTELPEDSQRDIINRAVKIWAAIVGNQARYQQQLEAETPIKKVTKN